MASLECLVVDDDESKRDLIRQAIIGEVGAEHAHITTAGSASEAVTFLRREAYDLLVVDVNLPLRSNEPPSKEGGTKLLKQIGRGTGGLIRPAFVVGITAYSDLVEAASLDFSAHGWAMLSYSPESSAWEEALARQCQHIYSYKSRLDANNATHLADVCIVTGLAETELEAVHQLPCDFKTVTQDSDDTRYLEGTIQSDGKTLRIIATSAVEMGNPASATAASKITSRYRPKVCMLVGICAGIEADIGDIVVGEFSLHYESGKYTEDAGGETVFLPQPRYQPASDRILEAIRRYKLEHAAQILSIPAKWPANKPSRAPSVVLGPVACGAAVVENKTIVEGLKFRDRKLVGLEMESYGFYFACRHATFPKTEYVMIKAACDRARLPKEQEYQKYGAFLSAHFAYNFLISEMAMAGGLFS